MLGEPFKKVFDEALVDAHDRLRRDPRNREAKVDFVTIYHMIIEGTLGITASHFLLDFLRERGVLPGFVDGYGRIAADEQRHIAYGTQFLQQRRAAGPGDGGGRARAAGRPAPGRRGVGLAAERGRLGRARASRTASSPATGSTRSRGG